MKRPPALALVLAATVSFAFKGVIAKLAYATGLQVIGLMTFRVLLATPLFWLGWRLMDGRTLRVGRDGWTSIACGSLFFAAGYSDFSAIHAIGAGPSRVLLFSFPLLVMLLEAARDRRPPAPRQLLAFALAWPGLALVAAPGGLDGLNLAGVAWALTSAATYALYLFFSQALMARLGSVRFTALSNAGAALTLLAALPWLAGPGDLDATPEALGWLVIIAVFCTVMPFFMLFEGIRRLGATRASLITLVGPPITVAAAWWILDEQLTASQLAGAALVLAGVGSLKLPAPSRDSAMLLK